MAEKPRVKAPKQRAGSSIEPDGRRRVLVIGAAVVGVVLGFVAVAALLGFMGGSDTDPEAVRAKFVSAGCTFKAVPAIEGQHSLGPDETSDKWNTDPPTSGPHYGFNPDGSSGTVIWGIYDEPIQLARLVHNVEHGGIYILYGDDVPDATVEEIKDFYDRRQSGTIVAPLPRLGDKIAFGAWVAEGEEGNGYLAKCSTFDEEAASAFFAAFQFKGPERLPGSSLLPGGT
jgi:hypothetical protein